MPTAANIALAAQHGFTIVQTGGGCTAWRKDTAHRYALITNEDGTNTDLCDLSDSYLVGAYAKNGDELGLLFGDASSISTFERAIADAEALLARVHVEVVEVVGRLRMAQVIALAKAFGEKLQEQLAGRQMREVIYLNKVQDNPGVCHSHDFCDANMVMLDAWNSLNLTAMDLNADSHLQLWNDAWDIAKAADFFI